MLKSNNMLETLTENAMDIFELTLICNVYGYPSNNTKVDGTFYLDVELKSLTQSEVVTPLQFVEILVRDAHSAANTSEQDYAAHYKESLKQALLERIDDLERTLRYTSPTLKETKNQLEAKLALINLVEQI